jgi:hypothetical protein
MYRIARQAAVPLAIVIDYDSPHLSSKADTRVGKWAEANNQELASALTNASFLNRIECHFTALRYFALNCADNRSHEGQNSLIRCYIAWWTRYADDETLRTVSKRAKGA